MVINEDNRFPIEIIRVVDGDGFSAHALDGTNKDIEVRLFAVDAPEGRQKYGRESTDHLRNLTRQGRFWVEVKDQDQYGRVIGIVYKDGLDLKNTLNYSMVRDGWAYWYSRYERERTETPDGDLVITEPRNELGLREAEAQAYMESKGVWVEPDLERPWDYKQRLADEERRTEFLFLKFNDGAKDEILRLITQGVNTSSRNEQSDTFLHLAAGRNMVESVTALIQAGAQLDAENGDMRTPLHIAASNGLNHMVVELLEAGADGNLNDKNGDTALHLAAREGHEATASALLDAVVDVDQRSAKNETPLHIAATNGPTLLVDNLCSAGADLNARDSSGNTPLHLAIVNRRSETEALLIAAGADVTAVNDDGNTPLQIADGIRRQVKHKRILIGVAACLIAVPAAIIMLLGVIESRFESAVRNNNVGQVKMLTGLGIVNVNALMDENAPVTTPLMSAVETGNVELAIALIDAGAGLYPRSVGHEGPLMLAARLGNLEMVNTLISAGANPHNVTALGTPLHAAASQGDVAIVLALLEAGADVNVLTIDTYYTPLHVAAIGQRAEIGRVLIEAGADYNALNTIGITPLHLAAKNGDLEFARMLADSGADVNAGNSPKGSPLHHAITMVNEYNLTYPTLLSSPNPWIVPVNARLVTNPYSERDLVMARLLISLGANVNAADSSGYSTLHRAATLGTTTVVEELLKAGADVNLKTNAGETALAIAERRNRTTTAALILEYGGER